MTYGASGPPFPRFATIYETRNLTRAAARLRRTHPALTYQQRRLDTAAATPGRVAPDMLDASVIPVASAGPVPRRSR